MIICDYIINATEIIGIGPMMLDKASDPKSRKLYNRRKLWFSLFLKHQSLKIESNWLDVGFGDNPDAQEKQQRAEYLKFNDDYQLVKAEIVSLLEPPTAPQKRKTQNSKLETT